MYCLYRTKSKKGNSYYKNRVNGNKIGLDNGFDVHAPNMVMSADITYVKIILLNEDNKYIVITCYVVLIIDQFSNMIKAFNVGYTQETILVLEALETALKYRSNKEMMLLFLVDHGSQFQSNEVQEVLEVNNSKRCSTRIGNCADNAISENTNGLLKDYLSDYRFDRNDEFYKQVLQDSNISRNKYAAKDIHNIKGLDQLKQIVAQFVLYHNVYHEKATFNGDTPVEREAFFMSGKADGKAVILVPGPDQQMYQDTVDRSLIHSDLFSDIGDRVLSVSEIKHRLDQFNTTTLKPIDDETALAIVTAQEEAYRSSYEKVCSKELLIPHKRYSKFSLEASHVEATMAVDDIREFRSKLSSEFILQIRSKKEDQETFNNIQAIAEIKSEVLQEKNITTVSGIFELLNSADGQQYLDHLTSQKIELQNYLPRSKVAQ